MRGWFPDVAGLLFDLDGTLIDSGPTICDAASQAFLELGVEVEPRAVLPHLGAPLQELYEVFIGDGDEVRYGQFVTGYVQAYDGHPGAAAPPLPGVAEGLRGLTRSLGLPMAVATTKPTHRAVQQMEHTGLHVHFRHIQGTDVDMRPKPAPDVVLRAAAALGQAPERTVLVGDTARDVGAARAAGARAVVVAYSEEHRERAESFGADLIIGSLEELVGFSG